ncbi:hypothetical protein FPY71_04290 [Aureimonas fodinaquatilis]|uniref:Phage holin family protein n=1 Tax=Aureimonas fodinaquatilis TaxID=2565783 RepID=A0A5B0DZV1_9HYPH|nr:hypothetical protein [Aureimonas fodinaquatilis]KAA0972324.1 hypothetical protein FPY71_04290 [Aureimonas fodinaquatilis]
MLGQLITKVFTGEASIFLARLRQMAIIYALMAFVAFFLAFFLIVSGYIWLTQTVGALPAALYFAGGCAVLLAILYIVLLVVGRPPKERASDRLQRDVASIAGVAALANAPSLLRSVKRRKGLVLIPVAGLAVWAAVRAYASRRNTR